MCLRAHVPLICVAAIQMEAPKPVVAYFYDQELGNFCLGDAFNLKRHAIAAGTLVLPSMPA